MSFNGLNKSSNLSLDILLGKDETIEIKDVLTGGKSFLFLLSTCK